jgi:uncharacterized protein
MIFMKFDWDYAKDKTNKAKHRVSFQQASKVFADGNALDLYDDGHSELEERIITIGRISNGLVLVVWTEPSDDIIRIISARWASKQEKKRYYEQIER